MPAGACCRVLHGQEPGAEGVHAAAAVAASQARPELPTPPRSAASASGAAAQSALPRAAGAPAAGPPQPSPSLAPDGSPGCCHSTARPHSAAAALGSPGGAALPGGAGPAVPGEAGSPADWAGSSGEQSGALPAAAASAAKRSTSISTAWSRSTERFTKQVGTCLAVLAIGHACAEHRVSSRECPQDANMLRRTCLAYGHAPGTSISGMGVLQDQRLGRVRASATRPPAAASAALTAARSWKQPASCATRSSSRALAPAAAAAAPLPGAASAAPSAIGADALSPASSPRRTEL